MQSKHDQRSRIHEKQNRCPVQRKKQDQLIELLFCRKKRKRKKDIAKRRKNHQCIDLINTSPLGLKHKRKKSCRKDPELKQHRYLPGNLTLHKVMHTKKHSPKRKKHPEHIMNGSICRFSQQHHHIQQNQCIQTGEILPAQKKVFDLLHNSPTATILP